MKRFLYVIVLFALAGLTAPLLAAPSVQLRVDVNPKTVYIGDPIQYSLLVIYSSSVAASPLEIPNPLGEFELLAASTEPAQLSGDKIRLVHNLLLTTYSTGTQTIPALALHFMVPGGQIAEAKTEAVPITVKSLLAEKGDVGSLMPLKGLFSFKSYLWLWILLVVILLLGLGFATWTWLKKRRGESLEPQGPPRLPEETIWEVIDRLERSDLLSTGQFKEYYSQLSQAVREYLEQRFSISALDRTTSELVLEFRRVNLPLEPQSTIRYFLETCDLVKFAKYTPSEQETSDDLERVKKFVAVTTPQKEAPKAEEALPL